MNDPQFITAPDGSELAVLPRERLQALLDAEETLADYLAIAEGRASIAAEGGIPLDVERAIAGGEHPIVAWRKFRSLTQGDLAEACGMTQPAIARLEKAAPGSGKPATLKALANALGAPLWTLQGTH
ncbi:helix-turn-helix transcriptional regulator [Tsuneonella suprasediminis]|uniref:helix-turn-helix domain-containing protein n=1 Tax=Tsuneonella suprasediminis TaxID=2306996 RepID=UPI002F93D11B